MQFSILSQALDGCHRVTANPLSGIKATVNRLAVKPDRASAAITGIASLFHSKPAQLAKKCSQALAGPRRHIEPLSIHSEGHWSMPTQRATWVPFSTELISTRESHTFAFFCSRR
jgi:hypothetical protein